jgi:hypothetical protein
MEWPQKKVRLKHLQAFQQSTINFAFTSQHPEASDHGADTRSGMDPLNHRQKRHQSNKERIEQMNDACTSSGRKGKAGFFGISERMASI